MGFLDTPGKSLTMDEIKEHKNLYHKAICQFLKIYQKYKNIQRTNLKFGDEVEYYIAYNGENRISLLLSANEMCDNIREDLLVRKNINFRPEYAKWMIESIPKNPYNNTLEEIDCVEKNMYARRKFIKERLPRHCDIYAVSAFPRMGCPYFNVQYDPNFISPYSLSTNIDDKCINDHIRFSTLTRNIRKRKGKKVGMTIPIQQDKLTTKKNIDIDCMAFGMGCNCLQVTFECPNLKKARFLYDQFAILTPIFLALTASSPMLMGYLMDRDHRWDIICAAVDDRTEQEMNSSHSEYQPKSRYSSISTYLSEEIYEQREYYNNVKFRKNKDVHRQLGKEVDPLLADHVSYLFSRDFITLFSNSIDNWENNTNLFESIQTSNWNNVRVKLPENDDDGWKMEFRPMEIQYTDFENSAFVVFSLLLFNLLMETDINFYIPLEMVDTDFITSAKVDAVLHGKFSWRININEPPEVMPVIEKLSVNEIVNGCDQFIGLIPLIKKHVNNESINKHLDFVSKRASGKLPTYANIMRNFVTAHPSYYHDSKISDTMQKALFDHLDLYSLETMVRESFI